MTPTTPIPDGSVIITPTEVYRELRATHDAVRDVGAKLDGIAEDIRDHSEVIDDHETRIRALESKVWLASGAVGLVAAAAGIVVPLLIR